MTQESDPVYHPSHYTSLPVECWDITQHFMSNPGNAIKYIWRAGQKGDAVEDYRKAIAYIQHEIARLGGTVDPPRLDEAHERINYLRTQCSAAQESIVKHRAWASAWKKAAKKGR